MKVISVDFDRGKFNYKAGSILIHNNKVLLQRPVSDDIWFLPGGRVEFFEQSEDALNREMIEELNVRVEKHKLIWIVQHFLEFTNSKIHEIGLYYWVTLPKDHPILSHEDQFIAGEEDYFNKWIAINDLEQYNVVPEFVISELRCLNLEHGVKHIITKGKC
jgi:8-oxo-dGTP pyrophosphatase MutT (NUDIX family)